MPKISVLMPVYNAEGFLDAAIQSILNQTYADFELIILNDASTDNSKNIIDAYRNKDERIIYVENSINSKIVVTLNKGISLATGKYIARMDADDIALPERFEKQVEFLEQNTGICMVDVLMEYIDENGTSLNNFNPRVFEPAAIRKKLPDCNVLGHSSIMIRTDILKKFNYKQTNYEDYELWLRLTGSNYKIAKLNQPLLLYRIHDYSITQKAQADKSHFYKAAKAKALYLSGEIKRLKWSFFNTKVLFFMLRDFALYIYKKMK